MCSSVRACLLSLCACALSMAGSVAIAAPQSAGGPSTETIKSQAEHARGTCGSLGVGTGLMGGKGWIVSMLPGKHELRVVGGGRALLTAARLPSLDFDAGRPYYIVMEDTSSSSSLEWKVPGSSTWAPVPVTFLYPPAGVTYGR